MDIGIIGGGAIGLLVSSYLNKKHEVTIYVKREEQVISLQKSAIELYDNQNLQSTSRIKAEHISKLRQKDVIIICVKQYQLKDIIGLLPENQTVIFLQNGMGHISIMKKRPHSYIGIVEHGAVRKKDYQVAHFGNGKITLASVTGDDVTCHRLVSALQQESFPFQFGQDWELLLKEKLMINAVINPLTALFNVPNHAIMTNKYIEKLAFHLCKEAASVLHLDVQTYWKKLMEIAKSTGENMSSMRADILNNRKSEIDAISGYILQHSEAPLPYTYFIYHAILALETRESE